MRVRHAVLTFALLLIATTLSARERRIQKTVDLNANGAVSIDTHNGSITVTTWSSPRVQIDARIEPGDSDYPEDVDKTEVRITGGGSSVRIESDYTAVGSHVTGWFNVNRTLPLIHYTISMPATASLDIDDHNATVRVTGLRGDLNIDTHNGAVDVDNHAGRLDVDAHNARVRVGFADFAKAASIETHNGAVELRLPNSARFHVNASGHNMGVDSDFPTVTKRMSRGTYIGDVNGGGAEIRFTTHNGSLRLRRS